MSTTTSEAGPGSQRHRSPIRIAIYGAAFIVLAAYLYLSLAHGLRFFRVPSASMAPLILPDDFVATLRDAEYDRGDIIVLRDPTVPRGYLLKRIVGLPGDVVEVKGGALFLNGSYASEPYRFEPANYYMPPYAVLEDEVFVLGDNRNVSVDSHNWEADRPEDVLRSQPRGVPFDAIIGRVRYIYLPPGRAGIVKPYPLTNVQGE